MRLLKRFLPLVLAAWLCCAVCVYGRAEYDMNQPQNLEPSHLYAASALLVDQDSGEVLFAKDSRVRMYPASTTKIMTLLLALESGIGLEDQVTMPAEAGDVPEGSSVVPVQPGDVMSFADLLYGFMLSSGNDGANAVAVLVDGGIDAFVDHMNRRAGQIGCTGTHYVNAHGYHNAEHYTNAQDLALISLEAMKNPDFRRIVAAPKWTMTIQRGGKTVEQEIVSRNTLLQSGEKYYYPDCTGIKTGHHNKAGWCFVGSAEREGRRVICVVLNCAEEMSKWYDAARLFEYGFTRYTPVTLGSLLERCRDRFATARVENAREDDPQGGVLALELSDVTGGDQVVQLVSGSDLSLSAALDRVAAGVQVNLSGPLEAPVVQGDEVGTLTMNLEGFGPVTATLKAARSVEAQPEAAPEITEKPTEVAIGPEATVTDEPPAPHRGSGLTLFVVLALVLSVSAVAVVFGLRRAEKRRERARRRRMAQRGRARQSRRRPEPRQGRAMQPRRRYTDGR